MTRQVRAILMDHRVREDGRQKYQHHCGPADVLAHTHFRERFLVEPYDHPEHQDVQQAVRVVVKIDVGRRIKAKMMDAVK
jgi:hypothetical protein